MATLRLFIRKKIKADGTYRLYVRLTHKRKSRYIPTHLYLTKKQINNKWQPTDQVLLQRFNDLIVDLRRKLNAIPNIDEYDAAGIARIITRKDEKTINLLDLFRQKLKSYYSTKAEGTADGYRTVLNLLEEFVGDKPLRPYEFNVSFIKGFEAFLRKHRYRYRKARGSTVVQLYLKYLRAVYNDVRKELNSETETVLPNNPFAYYTMPTADPAVKRNLPAHVIRDIVFFNTTDPLDKLARDVFMISFVLCGMNSKDIYECLKPTADNRVEYNRSKTKKKRADTAFTSVAVQPELQVPIERYKDDTRLFDFHKRYYSHGQFNKSVNNGLHRIGEALGLQLSKPLTTYYARHSWATIARNDLRISKDDIKLALNHAQNDITDTYLGVDFTLIDDANRKVLDYVFNP